MINRELEFDPMNKKSVKKKKKHRESNPDFFGPNGNFQIS